MDEIVRVTSALSPAVRDADSVSRHTAASPAEVWDVIADGWTYPCWVVGAARMRAVDLNFPSPGTRLHHSFGAWPFAIDDQTICLMVEPGARIVLEAHGWPLGEAQIEISLRPAVDGGTEIVIAEDATGGPGRWLVPGRARQALIKKRNIETLRRLAYLAEQSPSPS
jgi:uncharacterized protein YndB with AHSA1/START domain